MLSLSLSLSGALYPPSLSLSLYHPLWLSLSRSLHLFLHHSLPPPSHRSRSDAATLRRAATRWEDGFSGVAVASSPSCVIPMYYIFHGVLPPPPHLADNSNIGPFQTFSRYIIIDPLLSSWVLGGGGGCATEAYLLLLGGGGIWWRLQRKVAESNKSRAIGAEADGTS